MNTLNNLFVVLRATEKRAAPEYLELQRMIFFCNDNLSNDHFLLLQSDVDLSKEIRDKPRKNLAYLPGPSANIYPAAILYLIS